MLDHDDCLDADVLRPKTVMAPSVIDQRAEAPADLLVTSSRRLDRGLAIGRSPRLRLVDAVGIAPDAYFLIALDCMPRQQRLGWFDVEGACLTTFKNPHTCHACGGGGLVEAERPAFEGDADRCEVCMGKGAAPLDDEDSDPRWYSAPGPGARCGAGHSVDETSDDHDDADLPF